MPAKGYSSDAAYAIYLGRSLTAAETAAFPTVLEAAEEFIDHETGKTWLSAGTVTEVHIPSGAYLWLRQVPVASVTSVTGVDIEGDTTALTADSDYFITDSTLGILYVPGWASYGVVRVVYTPSSVAVPALLQELTNELLAFWLQRLASSSSTTGIKSFSVGQDLSITYQDAVTALGMPSAQFIHKLAVLSGKRLVFA